MNKKDTKERISLYAGVLFFLLSLLYAVNRFNIFMFLYILSVICFIYSRKLLLKYFTKTIFKRIKILNKKKDKLIKEISLFE